MTLYTSEKELLKEKGLEFIFIQLVMYSALFHIPVTGR